MRQRRHPNVVAVALANKNARIAWSLLTSDNGAVRLTNLG
jgi:transposase